MSECGCVYSSCDDGDTADFAHATTVVARKPHTCGECHDSIPVGAAYERHTGKWDGRIYTSKTCGTCVEIRNLLFCDGWIYGCVWVDIGEYFSEGGKPFGCLEKLTSVAAKDKLSAAYREFLGVSEIGE